MAKSGKAASGSASPVPGAGKARGRPVKSRGATHVPVDPARAGWATDLVFDVREPKLAVSLRLDADVLRFFRSFGSGYQTRINEVLKAFMLARGDAATGAHTIPAARLPGGGSNGHGKRARS